MYNEYIKGIISDVIHYIGHVAPLYRVTFRHIFQYMHEKEFLSHRICTWTSSFPTTRRLISSWETYFLSHIFLREFSSTISRNMSWTVVNFPKVQETSLSSSFTTLVVTNRKLSSLYLYIFNFFYRLFSMGNDKRWFPKQQNYQPLQCMEIQICHIYIDSSYPWKFYHLVSSPWRISPMCSPCLVTKLFFFTSLTILIFRMN